MCTADQKKVTMEEDNIKSSHFIDGFLETFSNSPVNDKRNVHEKTNDGADDATVWKAKETTINLECWKL